MKFSRKQLLKLGLLLSGVLVAKGKIPAAIAKQVTPLISWQDGEVKSTLVDFITRVTNPNSPDFVPVAERIVVFDNDGTLWSEYPMYFQFFFVSDRIKALAPEHPEWQDTEPFRSILASDWETVSQSGTEGLLELLMATHAGMTTDEFNAAVKEWITTARHPKTNRLYTEMVFQPMLELLSYLNQHDFKTYIVSGGGIEFMRVWAESVYQVPPEQVIGSSIKTQFELRNGEPTLVRLAEIEFIDDKENKPVAIHKFIGRRPIMAFGNSDGDLQMLQWTTAGAGPRLGVIIHHTDSIREAAYDRESHVGRLDQALEEAPKNNWVIVDMQRDWRVIHPWEL
jgi:phosphoserine phosphatase